MTKIKSRSIVLGGLVIVSAVGAAAWAVYAQFGRSKYTSPPASVAATIAGDQITLSITRPQCTDARSWAVWSPLAWSGAPEPTGRQRLRRRQILKWAA